MDTSRSYVKMCRYAQDLQRSWQPETDDWWHVGAREIFAQIRKAVINGEEKWSDGENNYYLPQDIDLYGIVWLPRADQLQEMAGNALKKNCSAKQMKNHLKNFCYDYYAEYDEKNLTDEKIWLMYYMAKKFKKFWREGRWIRQKSISAVHKYYINKYK